MQKDRQEAFWSVLVYCVVAFHLFLGLSLLLGNGTWAALILSFSAPAV